MPAVTGARSERPAPRPHNRASGPDGSGQRASDEVELDAQQPFGHSVRGHVRSIAADSRNVCAANTLSSTSPCTSSSGRASDSSAGGSAASSISELCAYTSLPSAGSPRYRSVYAVSYSAQSVTGAPATAQWYTSGRRSTASAASQPPNDQPRIATRPRSRS